MEKKGKILVVDDEPIVLKLLAMQVERLNYHVFTAGTGSEAIELLKTEPVDILITDIVMPDVDGITLMREALAVQPELECVVVSGQAEVSTAVDAMKMGAVNYIQKPVSIMELEVSLAKGMERAKLLRDLKKNQQDLQKAARELSEETAKNKMILESAGEGIVGLDSQGQITLFNPAAQDILNIGEEEALGKQFADLVRPRADKNAEGRETDPLPPVWTFSKAHDASAVFYRSDNTAVNVEYVSSPLKREQEVEGAVLIFNDVSEKKKAELALQKSEAQLRTLMESTQVGIFLYRGDDIIFANPVLEATTGYTVQQCLAMPRWGFIHPEHQEMVRDFGWARQRGESPPARYEVKILTKGGDERWLDFLVNMITLDGELTGLVSFIDITERKNIEEELGKYQVHLEKLVEDRTMELARTNQQLQEDIKARKKAEKEAEQRRQQLIEADKMVSLGILVAGVAHEINNPNNFITMNAPILHRAWDDFRPILETHFAREGDFPVAGIPYSEMREHIPELFSGILDGSERIRKIVLNLRDYARQGISDMSQMVDINDVVRAALVLLANPLKKASNHLEVSYGDNLPTITGNFQRAEQVVINLIQNAYQALTSPDKRIRIATSHNAGKGEVIVEIADQGCGIPNKNLKRIQDPFFTTKRDSGGSGLGLSISAGIMEEHGGRLEFDCPPEDQGTIARAVFPATSGHH